MNLKLKKPCGNCPFLKVGSIELQRVCDFWRHGP